MLDAVYIDTKHNLVVAVKPKPPFNPVFRLAASKDGSEVRILKELVEGSSVFLMEAGDSWSLPEQRFASFNRFNKQSSNYGDGGEDARKPLLLGKRNCIIGPNRGLNAKGNRTRET